ncbi:MAG: hypothetical protein RL215_287 [Planctomycetota bacterium]
MGSGEGVGFGVAVWAEFCGVEVADEAGVNEFGVHAGVWEEFFDEELVGLESGEVGAHVEGDAAKGHGTEELGEDVPGLFFAVD